VNHAGDDPSHYWANWDICNMTAILSLGVLCDDRAKFGSPSVRDSAFISDA
jgi:hypothetical protein